MMKERGPDTSILSTWLTCHYKFNCRCLPFQITNITMSSSVPRFAGLSPGQTIEQSWIQRSNQAFTQVARQLFGNFWPFEQLLSNLWFRAFFRQLMVFRAFFGNFFQSEKTYPFLITRNLFFMHFLSTKTNKYPC